MEGVVVTVVVLVVLAELGAYLLAPHLLAPFAVLPLGAPIPIELGDEERDALTRLEGGGLRQRPNARLELATGPNERVATREWTGTLQPARREAVLRLRRFSVWWNQPLGLARIRIVERDGQLEAKLRYLPTPASFMLTVVLVFASGERLGGVFALPVLAMFVLIPIPRLRRAAREAVRELEDRLIPRG
jgi:hypothetical protein